jgi:hypothetical protein
VKDLLKLDLFDRIIEIICDHERAMSLVRANFGAFATHSDRCHIQYKVLSVPNSQELTLIRNDNTRYVATDESDFLFWLEKDLTIEIEKLRPDLYFIHAAALSYNNQGCLLVAPSGVGKSTTTWALLHHGFEYVSDELAPIDLNDCRIFPYPHAICLKQNPPEPYTLPSGSVDLGRTIHIPVGTLPYRHRKKSIPLTTLFFPQRANAAIEPSLIPMSKAQAATRLYVNALNPLAHPGDGLDASIELVRNSQCYELNIGDLSATAALIRNFMHVQIALFRDTNHLTT